MSISDRNKLILRSVAVALMCLGIGALSGITTAQGIGDWYTSLNKPFFNPPDWVFAPVWTLLYILMGISAGLVWHYGRESGQWRRALGIFGVQLFLNALWSPLFFGLQNPLLAFIDILLLAGAVTWCMYLFRHIKPLAFWLLSPYLVWVLFATLLNGFILYLN